MSSRLTLAKPLVKISNLSISFANGHDSNRVVKAVDMILQKGKIHGLVGESGSGKTMLALSILGLLPPGGRITGGEIGFAGMNLAAAGPKDLASVRGAKIGMIFQEPMMSLNPSLKVGFQLTEGLRRHQKLSVENARQKSLAMLERIQMRDPEACLTKYPHEFSGGMRQRIMIASVLMLEPQLLIADEPTTALDVLIQKEVMEILVEVASQLGTTIMLISHDLGLIANYAHDVTVMCKGEVVESGPTNQILLSPKHAYTRELLASLPKRVANEESFFDAGAKPYLEAIDIQVQFESKRGLFAKPQIIRAVDQVNLQLIRGQTTAVVGESGSGKTTLGRVILGLTESRTGQVVLEGRHITNLGKKIPSALRRDLQMVFQDPFSSLDPRMRVGAIIGEGLRLQKDLSKDNRQQMIDEIFAEVGMEIGLRNRFPHELSGGQRQRVCIARAIIVKPSLIVVDEPVSALDVTVQAKILTLLKSLQKKYGFTCMFISHDLGVVEQVADRVAVMYGSRFVETGSRNEVFDHPSHPYTCRLMEAVPQLQANDAGGYRVFQRRFLCPDPPDGYVHYEGKTEGNGGNFGGVGPRMIDIGGTHRVACLAVADDHRV